MSIAENIREVSREIPAHVRLIGVSKFHPADAVKEAFAAGLTDFGENKVQELSSKAAAVSGAVRWHMIGHLQRNKVKYIAPFVHLIHSVDSPELLLEINKQAAKCGRTIAVLLQMHISGEETKFGMDEKELLELLNSLRQNPLQNIEIHGLMGMAAFTDDEDLVRAQFRGLRQLFERVKTDFFPENEGFKELSMGMSGDYKIAIAEGSTMVRIGTAIFGARQY